ncbi:MAG: hypothetical protein ACR2OB_08930 [Solirubrobacteraceae bacterium]
MADRKRRVQEPPETTAPPPAFCGAADGAGAGVAGGGVAACDWPGAVGVGAPGDWSGAGCGAWLGAFRPSALALSSGGIRFEVRAGTNLGALAVL